MQNKHSKVFDNFHAAVHGLLQLITAPEVITLGKFEKLVKGIDAVNQTHPMLKYRPKSGEWADVVVTDGDWSNHGSYPGPIVAELAGGLVLCEAFPDPEGPEDYVVVTKPGSKAEAYLQLIEKSRLPKNFKYQVNHL